jgi:predicted nucleic acid-binding protein
MRYADTCLLVSLFFRDAGTDAALRWLDAAGAEPIMLSHWSLTEFSGAAAIKARTGSITSKLHREALAKFRHFAANRLTLISPEPADFQMSAALLDRFEDGLRSGDALHLAICARHRATLCTADKKLADAAMAMNMKAERIR